jgi:hypothetical protein
MQNNGKQQQAEVGFPSSYYLFDPSLTTLLQGEAEKKTAQTADAADGLYNQVAGMVNKVAGQVMGDSKQEASGEFVLPCPFPYTSPLPPFHLLSFYPRISSIALHIASFLPVFLSCLLLPLCPVILALFHRPLSCFFILPLTRVSRQGTRNCRSSKEGGQQARLE